MHPLLLYTYSMTEARLEVSLYEIVNPKNPEGFYKGNNV